MFSSVDVAYSSTWNKNSLLPPSQSLAPLLFSGKVSNSRMDGWACSRSRLGRSTEHSHGLVLQLLLVLLMACSYSQVRKRNTLPHTILPFLCFLCLFCLHNISFPSAQTSCSLPSTDGRLWPIWCPPWAFSPSIRNKWICVCSGATELSPGDCGALHSSRTGSDMASISLSPPQTSHGLEVTRGDGSPWGHPGSWGLFQIMFRKGVQELLKQPDFFIFIF